MIAAQGNGTYDLSDYNNPAYPLPKNCDIKIEGMAPGASLIGLKAGGEFLANSAILQSIDYAISNGANVINESFGANVYSDNNARDTIQLFNDAAVRHGITVTASTGDAGISGTQGSPSTDPDVISAGAFDGLPELRADRLRRRAHLLQRHMGVGQRLGAVVRRDQPGRAGAGPGGTGRGRLGAVLD